MPADSAVEPARHEASDEIERRHPADSLAVGLPEWTIERPPGFQISALFLLAGAADDFAEASLAEVGGDQPALTQFHPHASVRVDHASQVAAGARNLMRMAPKVGQLSFVSPDHEYRRSRTDFLLPARTSALVVLT